MNGIPTLIYFLFGIAGTLCRIALSTTVPFGLNRRTIVEAIVGGVSGFLLPYFGSFLGAAIGLDAAHILAMPVLIKGGVVFVLNYSGSDFIGELLKRRAGGP
jgi:hypothetical protein